MKLSWFKREGIFYVPVKAAGWIVLIAGIIFSVYRFIAIDSSSHSVSDTLRPFIINLVFIFAVYELIGFLTSSGSEK